MWAAAERKGQIQAQISSCVLLLATASLVGSGWRSSRSPWLYRRRRASPGREQGMGMGQTVLLPCELWHVAGGSGQTWELGVLCPHPRRKICLLTPLCLAFPVGREAVLWVGFGSPCVKGTRTGVSVWLHGCLCLDRSMPWPWVLSPLLFNCCCKLQEKCRSSGQLFS